MNLQGILKRVGQLFVSLVGLYAIYCLIDVVANDQIVRWFPQHPRLEEKRRLSICIGNLKQLGIAIDMYAADHQGHCPVDAANPTLVGSMQMLSNYLGSALVLHCLDDRRADVSSQRDFSKLSRSNISYSYVPNLIWKDGTRSIVALDRIDSVKAGSLWPYRGNHRRSLGNCVLFNDGSVECFHTKLPADLKDKDGNLRVLSP